MSGPPPPIPSHRYHGGHIQQPQVEIEMMAPSNEPATTDVSSVLQNTANFVRTTTSGVLQSYEGDKEEKTDANKDDFLDFDYEAVFQQHQASKLWKGADKWMKDSYNSCRLIWYHIFVFGLGLPWILLLTCINAALLCSYSWFFTPVGKIIKFILAASSGSAYKVIGILLKPMGKSLHKCIMTYCGHKCKKALKDVKNIAKDASKAIEA